MHVQLLLIEDVSKAFEMSITDVICSIKVVSPVLSKNTTTPNHNVWVV